MPEALLCFASLATGREAGAFIEKQQAIHAPHAV
jgi:hypothetical protein